MSRGAWLVLFLLGVSVSLRGEEEKKEPGYSFRDPIYYRSTAFLAGAFHAQVMESAYTVPRRKLVTEVFAVSSDGRYRGTRGFYAVSAPYDNGWNASRIRYGLTDRLEGAVTVPSLSYDGTYSLRRNDRQLFSNRPKRGLADPSMEFKYRCWQSGDEAHTLSFSSEARLPTAERTEYRTGGHTDVGANLSWTSHHGGIYTHYNIGYIDLGELDVLTERFHLNDVVTWGASVEVPVWKCHALAQLQGSTNPYPKTGISDLDEPPRLAVAGVRFRTFKEIRATVGIAKGLSDSAPDTGFILQVVKAF
jgi:hypothetical protein